MHTDRLRHLQTILRGVPENRFDIMTWTNAGAQACGFAGCALGWASQDETFQALGLFLSVEGYICTEDDDTLAGYETAMRFFDLTCNQAHFIFDPDYYSQYMLEDEFALEESEVDHLVAYEDGEPALNIHDVNSTNVTPFLVEAHIEYVIEGGIDG